MKQFKIILFLSLIFFARVVSAQFAPHSPNPSTTDMTVECTSGTISMADSFTFWTGVTVLWVGAFAFNFIYRFIISFMK